jgi:sugar lactone lactonase YvrE
MLGSCAVCERTHGPELMRLSPSGERPVLVTGQVGEAISGNTRGHDGTVYYSVWAPGNAARNCVHKLCANGSPEGIAALPADSGPNGLAIDAAGHTLYIADSLKDTIWSVPVSGGSATPSPGRPSITDGGVPELHDPKLQTVRINVPAFLAGAAP